MFINFARGFCRIALACVVLIGVAKTAASAPPEPTYKLGNLTITAPWSRQPPNGARVAGGYMRITNTGQTSDTLIGGSVPFAKRLEVHEMTIEAGVMKMRELSPGLEIKPGETVELKPGGLHVMFMDLTATPTAGQKLKLTLTFEKAGSLDVDLAVTAPGAQGSGGAAPSGAKPHHH
jgi:periplasmic copper chaperone A